MRFISGGTDGLVKYWTYSEEARKFVEETLTYRPDWIKDAVFAQHNTMGLSLATGFYGDDELADTIAVCGEKTGPSILKKVGEKWEEYKLPPRKGSCVKASWSIDGNALSIAYDDNAVQIFEEVSPGKWDLTSSVNSSAPELLPTEASQA